MVAEPAFALELKDYGYLQPFTFEDAENKLRFPYDKDGYWYPVRVCNMVLAYNPEAADYFAAKGVKAVVESGNVSTNITFAVCDMKQGDFPDQNVIASAAMKLRKGEISKFTSTGTGRALVVVCEDRVPGDAAKAQIWKLQVRGEVEALQRRQVPESWKKWNLDRLGFEPGEGASVVDAEIDE